MNEFLADAADKLGVESPAVFTMMADSAQRTQAAALITGLFRSISERCLPLRPGRRIWSPRCSLQEW